jgi:hypothetical protein
VQVDLGVEQLIASELDAVGDADVANVAAGTGGPDGLHYRFLGADRLDDRVRAGPAGHLLDARDALVAALADDVGRAELKRQLLPGLMAADGDDPAPRLAVWRHGRRAAPPRRHRMFEAMALEADEGITLTAYTAEPGTPSHDELKLLASWAATLSSYSDQSEFSMISTKLARLKPGTNRCRTSALTVPNVVSGRGAMPSLNAFRIWRLKSGRG